MYNIKHAHKDTPTCVLGGVKGVKKKGALLRLVSTSHLKTLQHIAIVFFLNKIVHLSNQYNT
jgi:hypothetical protein